MFHHRDTKTGAFVVSEPEKPQPRPQGGNAPAAAPKQAPKKKNDGKDPQPPP